VRGNFQRLTQSAAGCYALVDYVNFKGEGTLATERYAGQGWGLLQVLGRMDDGGNAAEQFSRAAAETLRRRVKNAPPARREDRWLSGWIRRVNSYSRP
jgi:hypothetical protein